MIARCERIGLRGLALQESERAVPRSQRSTGEVEQSGPVTVRDSCAIDAEPPLSI